MPGFQQDFLRHAAGTQSISDNEMGNIFQALPLVTVALSPGGSRV